MRAPIDPEPRLSGSRSRVGPPWVRQWGVRGQGSGTLASLRRAVRPRVLVVLAGPSPRPQRSVSRQPPSPARPLRPLRKPTEPGGPGALCARGGGGLGKRPRPLPRQLPGESPPESKPAGPNLGSVTQQTCRGRRAVPALGQRWGVWAECSRGAARRGSGPGGGPAQAGEVVFR